MTARTARAAMPAALALLALAGVATAQHDTAPGGDKNQAHRRVGAYLKEFDAVVAEGRGSGLAFAADQQGIRARCRCWS